MIVNTLKMQFCKIKLYKESVIVNVVFSALAVYIMFSLYVLLPNKGYSSQNIFIYVALAVIFEQSLATIRIPVFCKNIKKGAIVKYYKHPLPIYKQFIYEEIGESFFAVLCCSPLLLIVLIYCKVDCLSYIFFLISFILSLILSVLFTIDVFSITFLFWNYKSSKAILTAISGLMSGTMIPLILLPEWFNEIAYYTPFAYMVDYPIKVLLENAFSAKDFCIQCCWVFFTYILGKYVYSIVNQKMNVFGG